MSMLKFYYGTMRSGKSTMALQIDNNRRVIGEEGILISTIEEKVESRIGLSKDCIATNKEVNYYNLIADKYKEYGNLDYVIVDEAQFLSSSQVEDLGKLVDDTGILVICFGLLTDYQGRLFYGSKRLIEIADEVEELPLQSLCWCGKKATHNCRVNAEGYATKDSTEDVLQIGEMYEPLCRNHYREGMTKRLHKETQDRQYNLLVQAYEDAGYYDDKGRLN